MDRLRRLEGAVIVDAPITAYDSDVMSAAASWTPTARVVGHILAQRALSYAFLAWRIRELLLAGALQGRGDTDDCGVPTEVRACRTTEPGCGGEKPVQGVQVSRE
jgi:hypothetical protein